MNNRYYLFLLSVFIGLAISWSLDFWWDLMTWGVIPR